MDQGSLPATWLQEPYQTSSFHRESPLPHHHPQLDLHYFRRYSPDVMNAVSLLAASTLDTIVQITQGQEMGSSTSNQQDRTVREHHWTSLPQQISQETQTNPLKVKVHNVKDEVCTDAEYNLK